MKTLHSFVLATLALATPMRALAAADYPDAQTLAEDATRLGVPGQIIVYGQSQANLSGVYQHSGPASANAFQAGLGVTTARFLTPRLALGGAIGGSIETNGDLTVGSVRAGPALLFHAPISENTSLLPRLILAYAFRHDAVSKVASADTHGVEGELDVSFARQVGGRLGITAGPFVNVAWSDPQQSTSDLTVVTYGLKLGLLGWL